MADKWSDVLDNLIEAQVSGYETMRLDCSDVEALLAAAREAEAVKECVDGDCGTCPRCLREVERLRAEVAALKLQLTNFEHDAAEAEKLGDEADALQARNAALMAAMGEIRDNPLREHYCACADNARRALAKAREVKP